MLGMEFDTVGEAASVVSPTLFIKAPPVMAGCDIMSVGAVTGCHKYGLGKWLIQME